MHPESLLACLRPGPHGLLGAPCTFAQCTPYLQTCLWKEALLFFQGGLSWVFPELLPSSILMGLCLGLAGGMVPSP